jgi:hypothetical protein
MKKFINVSFAIVLAIWFLAAVYLSVNSLFGIFVEVNPTTSKYILAGSFLYLTTIGIFNKIKGGDFTQMGHDLHQLKQNRENKKDGCKTCKQKK